MSVDIFSKVRDESEEYIKQFIEANIGDLNNKSTTWTRR